MDAQPLTPAELINAVRQAKGLPPAPSPIGYQPSRALLPAEYEEQDYEDEAPRPQAIISPPSPEVQQIDAPAPRGGVISLASGEVIIDGQRAQLNADQLLKIKAICIDAIQARMEAELKELRNGLPVRRRTRTKPQ